MNTQMPSKIALHAVEASPGVIRLSKSRIALFEDESPVVKNRGHLPQRYNPVPLLIFFALWKLHSLQHKREVFQARSTDSRWVIQLYDLVKNCKKKETCWLKVVFGSHKNTPNSCAIHRVVRVFKDGREYVVSPSEGFLGPDEIALTLDGKPANSEDELHQLLGRLGVSHQEGVRAKAEERRTPLNTATSRTETDTSSHRSNLPEQWKDTIFLPFATCTVAQNDFKAECARQLAAKHALHLKWFGMGMEYGAPFLPDLLRGLVNSVAQCNISVSVAMLDPNWDYLKHLHPNWPKKVPISYDELVALADEYRVQRDRKKRVKIEIGTYKYVPNWHGFAINDVRLYVSTCSWKESTPGSGRMLLVGGENPYMLVRAEQGGVESWIAGVFNGWFDYAFNWVSRTASKSRASGRKRH